jgi:hypothetical protein
MMHSSQLFHALPVQVETPDASDEVLECPTLRDQLKPRPSPFVVSRQPWGTPRTADLPTLRQQAANLAG